MPPSFATKKRRAMPHLDVFTDLSILSGMISLIESEFDDDKQTPSEQQGIVHGRHIIALFIIEVLLKKTLDREGTEYKEKHNIKTLLEKLSSELQKEIGRYYIKLMKSHLPYTLNFCKSAARFADYLAKHDITHARYIWNIKKKRGKKSGFFFIILDDLVNLIYAIMIVSFGYDYEREHGPIKKNHDTKFLLPSDVQSGNVPEDVKLHNAYILK